MGSKKKYHVVHSIIVRKIPPMAAVMAPEYVPAKMMSMHVVNPASMTQWNLRRNPLIGHDIIAT
jgi:hypothetical protein